MCNLADWWKLYSRLRIRHTRRIEGFSMERSKFGCTKLQLLRHILDWLSIAFESDGMHSSRWILSPSQSDSNVTCVVFWIWSLFKPVMRDRMRCSLKIALIMVMQDHMQCSLNMVMQDHMQCDLALNWIQLRINCFLVANSQKQADK